ncbi:hypothetical protein OIDMADRAFT_176591 [Oidiodendron maius Zn]|uniref:Mid2 domain-containing protein n=1 Tax=Oidiodendron maius (strain Zn) TaxID=913774 RepID=A0A0C3D5F3_OIDMZ|nr:hypothetical protein OIDMADRAFT_176591 [Oidiodendron maius Zn]
MATISTPATTTKPTLSATPSASLVTSWLPITTAWSAPAACSSLIWEGNPPWLAVNDPGYGIYVNPDISCLPSAATQWWEQPKDLSLSIATTPLTTYLLGPITCPQAYTTATTNVQDSSTFVACCPSHYSLSSVLSDGHAGQCTSQITVGQEVSIVLFTTITDTNEVASAWVTTVSTVTSATTVNGIQVNGWNVAAQIPSSNSSPASAPASTTSSASSGAKATDSTQASTSANSTPLNNTKTGLSAKESIGIGIGVALGIIAIVALVLGSFWYRRRRRAAIDTPNDLLTAPRDQGYKAAASLSVQEMHSGFYGHEMEGTHPVGELYGGGPQNR